MADFWIRRRSSGEVRGPVNSAQLKALAKNGTLLADDEVGKTENGPWNQAGKIKGLEFAAVNEESQDFSSPEVDESHDAYESDEVPLMESEPGVELEQVPDFINVHSEPDNPPALVTAAAGESRRTRVSKGDPDNKYPALKIIVTIQTVLGFAALAVCGLSLLAWFFFLITSAVGGGGVSDTEIEDRMTFYRDMGLRPDREEVRAELESAQEISGGGLIAGSLMYWFSMISTAFAALYFFAFAQIIRLFMDIERNTRSG